MLDRSSLNEHDHLRMHEAYDRWPEIAKEAYETKNQCIDLKDNVDHIVFVGMGGSGAINDIFSSILSKTDLHVNVIKGFRLPNTVDSNTLVVTTSVSGNTIEARTVLESAVNAGSKIIAFSSGGKLQTYCTDNHIEYRNISMVHSPRASFSKFLYSMLKVLEPVLPIKKEDISESISQLEKLRKTISSDNLTESNQSLNLAQWIGDYTTMIYYPWGLQSAAIRFKNSLQENSKMHAMAEDISEACHNGIVAWEKPSSVKPILIQGEGDHVRTKEIWKILRQYFDTKNIDYREIFSVNGSILSKLINLVYIFDYTTIYRAVLSNIDPSPTSSIDFVKRNLSNFSSV